MSKKDILSSKKVYERVDRAKQFFRRVFASALIFFQRTMLYIAQENICHLDKKRIVLRSCFRFSMNLEAEKDSNFFNIIFD